MMCCAIALVHKPDWRRGSWHVGQSASKDLTVSVKSSRASEQTNSFLSPGSGGIVLKLLLS